MSRLSIRLLKAGEAPPWELLLEADPTRTEVEAYLARGVCYLAFEAARLVAGAPRQGFEAGGQGVFHVGRVGPGGRVEDQAAAADDPGHVGQQAVGVAMPSPSPLHENVRGALTIN